MNDGLTDDGFIDWDADIPESPVERRDRLHAEAEAKNPALRRARLEAECSRWGHTRDTFDAIECGRCGAPLDTATPRNATTIARPSRG